MADAVGLHHVEIWVANLDQARQQWGWLLGELGFVVDGEWTDGTSWRAGQSYVTVTRSPNLSGDLHDRRRPGVNHLAFHGGSPSAVDAIMTDAPAHGWARLYHERYPHAGGPDHYAGWLENGDGFKAEVVASRRS